MILDLLPELGGSAGEEDPLQLDRRGRGGEVAPALSRGVVTHPGKHGASSGLEEHELEEPEDQHEEEVAAPERTPSPVERPYEKATPSAEAQPPAHEGPAEPAEEEKARPTPRMPIRPPLASGPRAFPQAPAPFVPPQAVPSPARGRRRLPQRLPPQLPSRRNRSLPGPGSSVFAACALRPQLLRRLAAPPMGSAAELRLHCPSGTQAGDSGSCAPSRDTSACPALADPGGASGTGFIRPPGSFSGRSRDAFCASGNATATAFSRVSGKLPPPRPSPHSVPRTAPRTRGAHGGAAPGAPLTDQRPRRAGQGRQRAPVVPPRPDLEKRIFPCGDASSCDPRCTPAPRPGPPSRPPASPVPGQPIYRGTIRPGQRLAPAGPESRTNARAWNARPSRPTAAASRWAASHASSVAPGHDCPWRRAAASRTAASSRRQPATACGPPSIRAGREGAASDAP